jgi:hypothetical protein
MRYIQLVIKGLILTFIIVFSIGLNNLNGQDLSKIQLIDSESKNGIPYAYIKVVGENILERSDIDGYFSLQTLDGDSLLITHVAYKTLKTTYEKISNRKFIEMEELSIEVNPIVINPKSAETIVKRAIDSSFKALYEPMYCISYRRDQLFFRDTLVAEAKAEILYLVKEFFSPSHSGIMKGYLKNIIVKKDSSFNSVIIPPYQIPASYAPLNSFLVGVSKKIEKFVYYSKQEVSDSIFIIGVNPRLDFKPTKKLFLKYGRFVINKKTGKIMRIDTNASPEMLIFSRTEHLRSKDATRYIFQYSYSHIYDNNGFLSKVFLNIHYSYLENNPQNIWQNRSEIVFIPETKKSDFDELNLLGRDTSLIQMHSKYSPEFENSFVNFLH